ITTANTLNIPPPLMDRMEIIRIAGYTEDEKVEIARKHLIPHAVVKHGLDSKEWSIDDEALLTMIRRYTREAGVRNLERELSTLIRKAVKELMTSKKKAIAVTAASLGDYLGVPKFRYGEIEAEDLIGVVTGLAWTDVGGGFLRALARGRFRHRAALVRQARHPRARAGRRDAQRWALGRRRHGHCHRFGDDRHPGAPRRRHDRRDHVARPRAADRRSEGEVAGRRARRHEDRVDPGGERQGPGGNLRDHQKGPGDRAGATHGRGAGARERAQHRADRLGRGGGQARRRGGPGGRARWR